MAATRNASEMIKYLLFEPRAMPYVGSMLLLFEIVLNLVIIEWVPYTEIDWIAYMEEVGGFLNGQMDFAELKGQTGPLVYPAGFVYIYSAFYKITNNGQNILFAQYLFMILYMVFIATVFFVYARSKVVPPWVLILVCASRRIHSIFVLRLFNDCIAMLFLYAAMAFILKNRWSIGCILFSLAVSVKMNILLFAPALGLLLVKQFGILGAFPKLFLCAAVQILLGLPFLLTYPYSYLTCAFNFGREFFYIWTVNWKFLSEEFFLSKPFALGLLAAHLSLLVIFAQFKWCKEEGGILGFLLATKRAPPTPSFIVSSMFVCNFIGIVFSRTLHYQFYVWYYHTLPFILFYCTNLPTIIRIALVVVIEICWNVFPSNFYTSLALFLSHLTILLAVLYKPTPVEQAKNKSK